MKAKTTGKIVLGVVVVGAAVGVAIYVQGEVRRRRDIAERAVNSIQTELDGLDPVTRAAVVAKLGKDEVQRTRGRA